MTQATGDVWEVLAGDVDADLLAPDGLSRLNVPGRTRTMRRGC